MVHSFSTGNDISILNVSSLLISGVLQNGLIKLMRSCCIAGSENVMRSFLVFSHILPLSVGLNKSRILSIGVYHPHHTITISPNTGATTISHGAVMSISDPIRRFIEMFAFPVGLIVLKNIAP